MKTKYFIDMVKSLGVRLSDDTEGIDVYNSDNDSRLARVSYIHDRCFVVSLDSDSGLTKSEQKVLAELVVEYGMTPIEERKDEQRWHIHLLEDSDEYLNLYKAPYMCKAPYKGCQDPYDKGHYMLSDKSDGGSYQTEFTHSEIADWAGTSNDDVIDWIIDRFGEEVK